MVSQSSNISSIPIKDNWLILNFEKQDNIDYPFWEKALKEFLFNYKLGKNIELDSYFMESKLCYENSFKPYNLKLSDEGNLHLHKSYQNK